MSEVERDLRIEQLEIQLAGSKEQVELRNAAQRLWDNRDFKKVILQQFMEKECARYAQQGGNPALPLAEREDCLNIAMAAGHLKRFLSVLVQMGNAAENQLTDIENAIDAERAGEIEIDGEIEA